MAGLLLLASGVPETLSAYATAHTLDAGAQTIAVGPVAWQEAIKEFGTNGGGFFNANSAHPFENPTALTNILKNWLLLGHPLRPGHHARPYGGRKEAGQGAVRRHGHPAGHWPSPAPTRPKPGAIH